MKKSLSTLCLFLLLMVGYLAFYKHVVIYHEQHYLFRFSWSWISDTAHQNGWLYPMQAFLAQFAYWPWLGAAVWSSVLTGVYCMTRAVIRRLTGRTDWLQVSAIVPAWTFFTTVNIDGSLKTLVIVFLAALGVYVAVKVFTKPKPAAPPSIRKALVCIPVQAALFLGFYFYSLRPVTVTMASGKERHLTTEEVKNQKFNEKLMIQAAQAVRRKDWAEVIELSNIQAGTGVKNHLMTYFRGMAMYHRGELLDHLFDVPPTHGPTSLFFPWKADRNRAEFGGFVYEQLGALNSATHWEFEAMVGWGETAFHLINLSRYMIEAGKSLQAEKFIAPLKQTLFYRAEAKRLEQQLQQGDVPDLRDALKGASENPPRFDNIENIAGDCKYILLNDPANDMAKQYMMVTMLLANNLGSFYSNLKQFYPPGTPLSRLYREALCLVRLNYGDEQVAADGYPADEETQAAFQAFMAERGKKQFANFSADQKRSYWYYLLYLSPMGNQLNF